MNAEIDKRAEIRHIRHRPFQLHAFLEVGDVFDILTELRDHKSIAGIPSGFEQFLANIRNGVFAGFIFKRTKIDS